MSAQEPSGKTKKTSGFRFQDIEVLLADPSPARRCAGVRRLAEEIERGALAGDDWQAGQKALRKLANDSELQVRLALATALQRSHRLPRDVACVLAEDVLQVASVVLANSPVLADEDLIVLLGSGNGPVQLAIARRASLSATVARAVVDARNAAAVTALATNAGAELDEVLLLEIIDSYGRYETVKTALVERGDLPERVCTRLLALVPDRLKAELASKKALAEPLFGAALETYLDAEECAAAVPQTSRRARTGQALTASDVLRALCTGDIGAAEEAMAEAAGVSVDKACLLIHDEGPFGLKAIYRKCAFPEELFAAFRVAVDLARETRESGSPLSPEQFERTVVERILARYSDIETAELDYVLSKLSRFEAA